MCCIFFFCLLSIEKKKQEAPDTEPGLDQACIEKASILWMEFRSQPSVFTVEMNGLIPFSRFFFDPESLYLILKDIYIYKFIL